MHQQGLLGNLQALLVPGIHLSGLLDTRQEHRGRSVQHTALPLVLAAAQQLLRAQHAAVVLPRRSLLGVYATGPRRWGPGP